MQSIAEPASQTPTQPSAVPAGQSNAAAPSANSGGLLGAPQPLAAGVLEDSEPSTTATAPAADTVTAPTATTGQATGGKYVVQVGAVSDAARAREWMLSLSKRFGVQGRVSNQGSIHRVQLGSFSSRHQAAALQHRLLQEANQQSFITAAPSGS